jgi:hypothetical protein
MSAYRFSSPAAWSLALVLVCAAATTNPRLARAEKSADQKAAAEALFRDGRKLFSQHKFTEACPKFEESQRLDPSAGTLVNLATCHEKVGKLATAWAEYKDVLARATVDGRADRERAARDRIAAIEPKLGKLVVDIAAVNLVAGLKATRGDVSITSAALGTPLPVDAGSYTIQVTAPGYQPWSTSVEVVDGKETKVSIPALEKVAVDPPASTLKEEESPTEPPPPPPKTARRTAGYVVGGVGLVALGVGTVFGLQTLSKKSASDSRCVAGCTEEGKQRMDEAYSSATYANIGLGVGLVGLGVGTYLLLTSTSSPPPRAATASPARTFPTVEARRDGGSVVWQGTF